MASNVTYQDTRPATPPTATIVETEDQGSGVQRQVVKVANTVAMTGTVTANAGTNLNTSALALEAGGNLASIKAKTDNLDVALSTRLKPADTLAAVTTVGTITNPVDVRERGLEVSRGNVSGQTTYRKFGANPAIGTSETYVASIGGTAPYMPTIEATAGGDFVSILAGKGQTQGTGYCVPAGYSLYIFSYHITVDSNKACTLSWYQRPNADDVSSPFGGAKRIISEIDGLIGTLDFDYRYPLKFSAKTDLWWTAVVATGSGKCSIEYEGVLVAN